MKIARTGLIKARPDFPRLPIAKDGTVERLERGDALFSDTGIEESGGRGGWHMDQLLAWHWPTSIDARCDAMLSMLCRSECRQPHVWRDDDPG